MTLYYTKDHEWLRLLGKIATVGVSDHAQQALGDVVFVELPEPGREVAQHEAVAVVESVKAASEVYAPVTGRVTESNEYLATDPSLVNSDPENKAWFFKIELSNPSELDGLFDADGYKAFLATL